MELIVSCTGWGTKSFSDFGQKFSDVFMAKSKTRVYSEPPSNERRTHRLAVRFMMIDGAMDTVAQIEPRAGNAGNNFAFQIFTAGVRQLLHDRGYDLSTMRFHIDRKQSEIEAWDRGER
jgi:hypothetical protein